MKKTVFSSLAVVSAITLAGLSSSAFACGGMKKTATLKPTMVAETTVPSGTLKPTTTTTPQQGGIVPIHETES